MKIKKGDTVLIISGKDRLKKGKVLKILSKKGTVLVEGVNLKKKHVRPKKEGEKGEVVQLPAPVHVSSTKLICSKCGRATRVSHKIVENKKYRICKKCGQEI